MTDPSDLGAIFEEQRPRLRGVAYRLLGSVSEAEDAVQEAWLRLTRTEAGTVDNLAGWLTTVVARVCLDMLRARKSRREEPLGVEAARPGAGHAPDPESEAVLADSVGIALLVVLETLSPAERFAFVLHDLFGMPFEEIGPIVGRSAEAARQLASRARRRVRGGTPADARRERQREVVEAFVRAVRAGDIEGLLAVLDPDAVLHIEAAARLDATGPDAGMAREIHGAERWVRQFVALARDLRAVQPALIDGSPGLLFAPGGRLARALAFSFTDGRVGRVEVIADPDRLRALSVAVL